MIYFELKIVGSLVESNQCSTFFSCNNIDEISPFQAGENQSPNPHFP
jgi:hypothetical protein